MAQLVKIAIAGEGGQGVQAIGDILAEAGNLAGKEALYIPNFGVEQRGGVSVAFVQISDEQIGSPKFASGDIVIALSGRAVDRTGQYVTKDTLFVYDSSLITAATANGDDKAGGVELPRDAKQIIGIPATEVAQQELIPRVFNMIVLGATIRAAGIVEMETVRGALENKLGKKFVDNPKLREFNYQALERGVELVEKALQEGK
ncbi:MAG: pyruvate oxidoreductase subunit gamma [Firmicutes bacterium]|nr:pyruvate oxidoreductase subunit gamma [Bacillota bacterium]